MTKLTSMYQQVKVTITAFKKGLSFTKLLGIFMLLCSFCTTPLASAQIQDSLTPLTPLQRDQLSTLNDFFIRIRDLANSYPPPAINAANGYFRDEMLNDQRLKALRAAMKDMKYAVPGTERVRNLFIYGLDGILDAFLRDNHKDNYLVSLDLAKQIVDERIAESRAIIQRWMSTVLAASPLCTEVLSEGVDATLQGVTELCAPELGTLCTDAINGSVNTALRELTGLCAPAKDPEIQSVMTALSTAQGYCMVALCPPQLQVGIATLQQAVPVVKATVDLVVAFIDTKLETDGTNANGYISKDIIVAAQSTLDRITAEFGTNFSGYEGRVAARLKVISEQLQKLPTDNHKPWLRGDWQDDFGGIARIGVILMRELMEDVILADVNGDRRKDLVHIRTDNGVLTMRADLSGALGGFKAGSWYNTGDYYGGTPFNVVPADVNGDGREDLVHVRTDSGLAIWKAHLSDGYGWFNPSKWGSTNDPYAEQNGTGPFSMVAADVNGDGRKDLVHVRTDNGGYLIMKPYLSNGDGNFSAQGRHVTGDLYGGSPFNVIAADVNGDRREDLVHVRTKSGLLIMRVHLSNGIGDFSGQSWYPNLPSDRDYYGGMPFNMAVADVNGDGKKDLVHVRTDNGQFIFKAHFSNGLGSFTRQSWYQTGVTYDGTAFSMTAADTNGDRREDLVHVRTDNEEFILKSHRSNGLGGFSATPWYVLGDYSGGVLF